MVFKILDSYEEITIMDTDQQDNIVFFEIDGKEYGCWYPEIDEDTGSPFIFVKNDTEYNYPCDTLTHKHRSMRVKLHRLMAMRC